MKKLVAVLLLLNAYLPGALADEPVDLKGRPKQNKLVIHSCKLSVGERFQNAFNKNLEDKFAQASCEVVSDIDYSKMTKALTETPQGRYITSLDSISVKKSFGTYHDWVSCDGEDGDCIESSVGGFTDFVTSQFLFAPAQKTQILKKMIQNTSNKTTNLYFFAHDATLERNTIESIDTWYDLSDARLLVK